MLPQAPFFWRDGKHDQTYDFLNYNGKRSPLSLDTSIWQPEDPFFGWQRVKTGWDFCVGFHAAILPQRWSNMMVCWVACCILIRFQLLTLPLLATDGSQLMFWVQPQGNTNTVSVTGMTAAMLHNEKADRPKSPNDATKNVRLTDQGPKTYSNNPAVQNPKLYLCCNPESNLFDFCPITWSEIPHPRDVSWRSCIVLVFPVPGWHRPYLRGLWV